MHPLVTLTLVVWLEVFQAFAQSQPQPASPPPALDTTEAIQALSRVEADKALPARIRGVVSFSNPRWRFVFIEDQTGGIFCDVSSVPNPPDPGHLVSVEGVSRNGSFLPILAAIRIVDLGPAPLPKPRDVTVDQLQAGQFDGDLVRLRGVLISNSRNTNDAALFLLQVLSEGVTVQIHVPTEGREAAPFPEGSTVAVEGVFGPDISPQGRIQGLTLSVARLSQLELVVSAGETAQQLPLTPIQELRQSSRFSALANVRTRGVVRLLGSDEIWITDGYEGLNIQTPSAPQVTKGQSVEVSGIVQTVGLERRLQLTHLQTLSTNTPNQPLGERPVKPHQLFEWGRVGEWVTAEGSILHRIPDRRGDLLVLGDNERSFEARLRFQAPGSPSPLPLGSRVRVSGFLRLTPSGVHTLPSPRLLVPEAAGVRIVGPAPWTADRTLSVVSALSVCLALGVFALAVAHRRLRESNTQLANTEAQLAATNADLERRIQNRTAQLESTNARLEVEIREREFGEQLQREQAAVLEMIAGNAQLEKTLDKLNRALETQAPDILCSVLLSDANVTHLHHGSAPSLPEEYCQAINGIAIGPCVGSCGTAAHRREPVIVEDILTDPLWANFKDLAFQHGLRACWSTPIFGSRQELLGTFAIYQRTPGRPSPRHAALIKAATATAAICIARSQAEAAVQRLINRLDLALDGARVGVWEWRPTDPFVSVTPQCEPILGLQGQVHDTQTLRERIHPDDLPRLDSTVESALSNDSAFRIEIRILQVHGNPHWIEVSGRGEVQTEGQEPRIVGIMHDITDRKRTEDALKALVSSTGSDHSAKFFADLSHHLASIFQTPFAVVGEFHGNGKDRVRTLAAWAHGQLVPNFEKEIPGSPCEGVAAGRLCLYPSGVLEQFPNDELFRQLGVESYLGIPVNDTCGTQLGMLAVMGHCPIAFSPELENILKLFAARAGVEIERSRNLDALMKAESRFRSAIENSFECLALTDTQDVITYVSPAVTGILGRSPAELIGKSWSKLAFADDLAALQAHKARLVAQVSTRAVLEFRVHHADGSIRWVESSDTNQLHDPNLRAVVSNFRDISERKNNESLRATLEEQLRQSQKMEALGTLAGGIAHDFNNILAAIMGCAGLTRLYVGDSPEALENLDDLLKASNRAKDLIKQILTFSRRHEQRRWPVQLDGVLTESAKLLRASLPSNVELQVGSDHQAPTVQADPTLIQQVILNLATNAAQAIGARPGRVEIHLSARHVHQGLHGLQQSIPAGHYALLSVRDNGLGMKEDVKNRMFEPFFTTKEPGQGTGLGLAVVHGIVRAHEGEVVVSSQPGLGTLFEVYLPASATPSQPPPAPAPKRSLATATGERILLVDDEPALLKVNERVLSLAGYQVTACQLPSQAWDVFQTTSQSFDLVLTDYAMPGLTGIELSQRMLSLRPNTPIVICTGYGAGLTREQALHLGFREILLKPIEMEDLCRAVRSVLHSSSRS